MPDYDFMFERRLKKLNSSILGGMICGTNPDKSTGFIKNGYPYEAVIKTKK